MVNKLLRVFFIVLIVNSISANAGIITLGDLQRDDGQSVISSQNGLEWLMWNHAETLTLSQWEAELIDPSSSYYGWRIANVDEVFQMLYQTGLRLETFGQGSLSTSCYDNDPNTICNTSQSSAFTFDMTINSVKEYNVFFTGQELGQNDTLHSTVAYKANSISFPAGTATFGVMTTHQDSGGYVNASMGTHNDLSYLSNPLGSAAWRLALVRNVDVPEPSSIVIFFLGLAGLVIRKSS